MGNLRLVPAVLAGLMLTAQALAGESLGVGSTTAAPGGRALVPVTLDPGESAQNLTVVTATVAFDAARLTFLAARAGLENSFEPAAAIQVLSASSGSVRLEIGHPSSLRAGTLLEVGFRVAANAPPDSVTPVSITTATGFDGFAVRAIGSTPGEVQIQADATDDHPDRSAGVLFPDDQLPVDRSAVSATIDRPGDVDFFGFDQQAGFHYVVTVGLGTLGDSVLTLFDEGGNTVLQQNDDFPGLGFASRVAYEAFETRRVHVRVSERSGLGTGTYTVTVSEIPADLEATNLTAARTSVSAGGVLPVTLAVFYDDGGNPDAHAVSASLIVDLETLGGQVVASTGGNFTLTPGQPFQVSLDLFPDAFVLPGQHVLRGRVDPGGFVAQADRSNDTIALAQQITVQTGIDVRALSVVFPPGPVSQDQTPFVTVAAGYASGPADLQPLFYSAALYLSTDSTFDPATDIRLISAASFSQSPGTTSESGVTVAFLTTAANDPFTFVPVAPGDYFPVVVVNDADRRFPETSRANNVVVGSASFHLDAAPEITKDFSLLSVELLTPRTSPGGDISFALTVSLTGTNLEPDFTDSRFFEFGFTTDPAARVTDLTTMEAHHFPGSFGSFSATAGKVTTTVLTLQSSQFDPEFSPLDTGFRRSGLFHLAVRIDSQDGRASNDFAVSANRIEVTTFTVDGQALFAVPASLRVTAGEPVGVTASFRNVSGDPDRRPMRMRGEVRLSRDTVLDASDILLGTLQGVARSSEVGLGAGSLTVPVETPPGDYRLLLALARDIEVGAHFDSPPTPFNFFPVYTAGDRHAANDLFVSSDRFTVLAAPKISAVSLTPLQSRVSPGQPLALEYEIRYESDDPNAPPLDIPVLLSALSVCQGCAGAGENEVLERAVLRGETRKGRVQFKVNTFCANQEVTFNLNADTSCINSFRTYPEVNESDNFLVAESTVIVEKLPDISLSDAAAITSQASPGGLIEVQFTAALDFLAADRPPISPEIGLVFTGPQGDFDMGVFQAGVLQPGVPRTIVLTAVLPISVSAGTGRVRITLDPRFRLDENDEQNNALETGDLSVIQSTPGGSEPVPANGDFSRGLLFWQGNTLATAPREAERPLFNAPPVPANRYAFLPSFTSITQEVDVPAQADRLVATVAGLRTFPSDVFFHFLQVTLDDGINPVGTAVHSSGFAAGIQPSEIDPFGQSSGRRTLFLDATPFAGQRVTLRLESTGEAAVVDDVRIADFSDLDLTASQAALSPAAPSAGTTFDVSASVQLTAAGTVPAPFFVPVLFRVLVDDDFGSPRELSRGVGLATFPSGAGTATVTATVALPFASPVTAAARVETQMDPDGFVAESIETNNVSTKTFSIGPAAGLLAISSTLHSTTTFSVAAALSSTVQVRFQNAGARAAPVDVRIDVLLSADATFSETEDLLVSSSGSSTIRPGETQTFELPGSVPLSARPGAAFLLVRAAPVPFEGAARALENVRSTAVTVRPLPGSLVAVRLEAPQAPVGAGDTVPVTATIFYRADGPEAPPLTSGAPLRLRISADERLDPATDPLLFDGNLGVPQPGQVDRFELSLQLPFDLPSGLFRLFLSLDEENQLAESDESQHVASAFLTVGSGPGASGAPVARLALLGSPGGGPQFLELDGFPSSGSGLEFFIQLVSAPDGAAPLAVPAGRVFYQATRPGTYRFVLTVRDRFGLTAIDSASIDVANGPPSADAGPAREIVLPGGGLPASATTTGVVLDARASRDDNRDPLAYVWSLLSAPQGSSLTTRFELLDRNSALLPVDFTLARTGTPQRFADAGLYRFGLEVFDPFGATSSASVEVLVLDPTSLVPAADAGADRVVVVRVLSQEPPTLAADIPDPTSTPPGARGALVRLDGRGSRDSAVPPRPLRFAWRLVASPPASAAPAIEGPGSATPSFVPVAPGSYRFELRVSNGDFESPPDFVRIDVVVRGANRPPSAEAAVVDRSRDRRALPGDAPLDFVARRHVVTLDGSLSSDADGGLLRYRWRQLAGFPVALSPSSTAVAPSFVPPEAGRYVFSLQVLDPEDLEGISSPVELRAVEAENAPPRLTVTATATTTDAAGRELPGGLDLDPPDALRVELPTAVTLTARAEDPRGSSTRTFRFRFRQAAGPRVLLVPVPSAEGPQRSAVSFEPTTPGVHLFEVRARDAAGPERTDETLEQILVVVESAAARAPDPAFLVSAGGVAKALFRKDSDPLRSARVAPGAVVTLDGTQSRDRNTPPGPLGFQWEQLAGPPVELSDPFSETTTFVAGDPSDRSSRRFVIQLLVDGGDGRAEPVAGVIETVPDGSLILGRGLSLVGVPVDPTPGGPGDPYAEADLARDTGTLSVVRSRPATSAGSRSRFVAFVPSPQGAGDAVLPTSGYLLLRSGSARIRTLSGAAWPPSARGLVLEKGLNFVAYPPPVPAQATAEDLRELTGASFVGRVNERGRFEVYVPGVSNDFEIESGRGYLLSIPEGREVTLP